VIILANAGSMILFVSEHVYPGNVDLLQAIKASLSAGIAVEDGSAEGRMYP
jgi:hypothetical protein